jgi:hypothetical protein
MSIQEDESTLTMHDCEFEQSKRTREDPVIVAEHDDPARPFLH